jgi:hypothetical protein
MIHNIPQPAFEEFVANRLAQDGGVEIRKNHSYVSCEQVIPYHPSKQHGILMEPVERRQGNHSS